MPKFRKKPLVIEAVQLNWRNWDTVCELLGDALSTLQPARHMDADIDPPSDCGESRPYIELDVTTIHGDKAVVRHGDWIIRDGKLGTFYPCDPKIFAVIYEPIEETAS